MNSRLLGMSIDVTSENPAGINMHDPLSINHLVSEETFPVLISLRSKKAPMIAIISNGNVDVLPKASKKKKPLSRIVKWCR